MINIVIPMAGGGQRFREAGYAMPKPFVDVAGATMIERVLDNLRLKDSRYILIVSAEHAAQCDECLQSYRGVMNINVVPVDRPTEGAACTLLWARPLIDHDDPLLIANCDQVVDTDVQRFFDDCIDRHLDGSIMTFVDPYRDPKWSFAKVEDGLVVTVREKEPIAPHATVGIYLYRRGRDFVDAAVDMIVRNDRVNNEFYTCPTFNYAIANGLRIGTFDIDYAAMHGLGTPDDLERYVSVLNDRNKG